VKSAVTKEGCVGVYHGRLLANLRDIAANPIDKNLQAKLVARRDIL
jgi:hypothetical protein